MLETSAGRIEAGKAVFCAGLMSDRLARKFGVPADFQIVPFRGENFRFLNQPADLVRHLIYPVPDPERPFLGVHLTRKIGGGFTVGPNAVLSLKREGYSKLDISPRDVAEILSYPGFWRLVGKNFSAATSELTASVRAQAVARDGSIIDDFLFSQTEHTLHVCNAPSPAATAAFPIARYIVEKLMASETV